MVDITKNVSPIRVDRPGGHAEPDQVLEVTGRETISEATPDQVRTLILSFFRPGLTLQVRRELFDCIQREVRDELNIPLNLQHHPELLGTVINHERAGRLCKYHIVV